MILKGEIYDLIDYLNTHETMKGIEIKLEENKWKINYMEFSKHCIIEDIEKKTYKNSFDEEFDVYKFNRKVNGEIIIKKYIIKLADKKYLGVMYHIRAGKYYLIKLDGEYILEKRVIPQIDKGTAIKTKDIVKKLCDENDALLKNKIKLLLNKEEEDYCYDVLNAQILNRTY